MIRLAGCATPTFLIDALAAICLLYLFFSPLLSPIFTSFPLDFLFAGSVQHGRSASFASSLAALPASLGSSAAIAATGCAASFALIGLTSRCFVPQFAIVALLRYRLQVSFAHWTSASPVSRTARGEAPSHWARASCAPRHCHPYQFPLKSYGFPGAETARKRFLLWKMGFSAAKIAPPPPYTPPGTIEVRKGFAPLLAFSTVWELVPIFLL